MTAPRQKVVMISGANRGIGGAIARLLHDSGYCLSLGVRRPEEMARLRDAFDGERTLLQPYEATSETSPEAWVAATVERFGRLDALVNAAGVLRRYRFNEPDETAYDEMMAINVKAPMRLTRHAFPHLERSGAGRVVTVVSMSGLRVKGGSDGYSMSKFALLAFTHSLRYRGWEAGVRSTAICPSWVNTDMVTGVADVPPEDMTQPEDVARMVRTVIELPNTASVSVVPMNCGLEASY